MRGTLPCIALLAFAFPGCTASNTPENALEAQVKAMWQGDAEGLLATYSADGYWDLGGCVFHPRAEWEARTREWLTSDDWKEKMGKYGDYRDLVDFGDIRKGPAGESEFSMKCSDETGVRADDTTIYVPEKEGAPFDQVWGGVFREVEGRWVMIAGD